MFVEQQLDAAINSTSPRFHNVSLSHFTGITGVPCSSSRFIEISLIPRFSQPSRFSSAVLSLDFAGSII